LGLVIVILTLLSSLPDTRRFAIAQFEKLRCLSRNGAMYARSNLDSQVNQRRATIVNGCKAYRGLEPRMIAATIGDMSVIRSIVERTE
jgi:hypothetical protein